MNTKTQHTKPSVASSVSLRAQSRSEKSQHLVPQLRFAEFEGDWYKMRLDEIAKIERGRFSPRPRNNPIYYNGDIPFVQTSDVVNSNGKIFEYSQTLNEKGLKVSKKFKKGTILITIAANIGFAGVLELDMACPDSLIGITCFEKINNFFLNYLLKIEQPKMDYLAVAAAQKNINIDFLKPYKFNFPTLPEQQKIASFLTSVDTKLQQLTKKKELLEQYKKGAMQQLFSQKIRFKPDNSDPVAERSRSYPDWEDKRLGEVTNIVMGQSPDSKTYNENGEGVFLIQGNADIDNRKSNPRQWTSEPTKMCQIGDLIMTVRAPVGYISKSEHEACIGRGVCLIRSNSKSNQEFIFQFLLQFEPRWIALEQGSTFTAVSGKDVKSLNFKIPSLKEQQKIANYLSAVDTKIAQVAEVLEATQQFKKGLLQQLFV